MPEKPFSIERFFKLPATADSRLKAIALSIRMQEKEHPFLEKFIKTAGWPRWDKSKIIGPQNRNNGRSNEDSSSLVYIPFVIDTVNTVKVVLAVNMEADDTAWQTLYANNYAAFGFDSTSSNNWNAQDVFQFFALFDHDIFGHTKFRLKDTMLFNSPKNSIIALKSIDGVPVNARTSRITSYIDVCSTWEVCNDPYDEDEPHDPDDPPDFARIASCYYTMNCVTYYYFNWSSGGGGSSGGGWWSSPTCTNTATGTPIACPPGWVPDPFYEPVYVNGILYTSTNYPGINEGFPWKWWENSLWIGSNLGIDISNQSLVLWLFNHIERAIEIKNYITTSNYPTLSERQGIVRQHIDLMMNNSDYLSYAESHGSYNNSIVWWEDDTWIRNPANFSLDLYNQGYEVTDAERALALLFPIQAWQIKENVQPAITMSNTRMGIVGPHSGHNDKNDAFRHAYFNAINTRDVWPNIGPYVPASVIVRMFAYAHETEVPPQLDLEKQMDIFNGEVGIDYCWNCFTTSDNSIADAIIQKLNNGELRYLKPLNNADLWWEIGPDGTKYTATNGIMLPPSPTPTQLVPTNQ